MSTAIQASRARPLPAWLERLPQETPGFARQRAERHFATATTSSLYETLLLPLANAFGLAESELHAHFLRYNLEINKETNATYQLLGTQFALLLNYLPDDTWFSRRLDVYAAFVRPYERVLDVGFGFPIPWLLASRSRTIHAHFTFVDFSESALQFGEHFIRVARAAYPRESSSLSYSMELGFLEDPSLWSDSSPQAVLALDCIEHSLEPLASITALARRFAGAAFLISLPVGTPIPQHSIDFDSVDDVLRFVASSGLTVTSHHLVEAAWDRDVVGNPDFKGSLFMEARWVP